MAPNRTARLIIICGLPGAGKTTLSRQLEGQHAAIRMCPDEWMLEMGIDLYDEDARAKIERLQWKVTQDLLKLGHTVIIEWGTWGRSERDELREGARALGAKVELRFLDAPIEVLYERAQRRKMEDPPLTMAHFEDYAKTIQKPDAAEFALFDPPVD